MAVIAAFTLGSMDSPVVEPLSLAVYLLEGVDPRLYSDHPVIPAPDLNEFGAGGGSGASGGAVGYPG